jgi:hypothetical protein
MPPARKASTKKARPKKARPASRTAGARKRFEDNDRVIRRITKSLDVALDDLAKIGGSVGAGVGELRRDLGKMLRDARRHATKMGNATRKDLERLKKDMTTAAKNSSGRTGRKSRTASSSKSTRTSTARRKTRTGGTTKKARSTTKAKATRKASGKSRAAR